MASAKLRFQRPAFPPSSAIETYLALSRAERWFTNFGPCWRLLQDRLSEHAGRPCIPVANGTLGLVVAIAALRRAAPDAREVLTPSFAHPSGAQAVVWNRLEPVFVDIESDHWHMSARALESALAERGKRVALVLALSAFGTPPPAELRRRWEALCEQANVPLVLDSAAGLGGRSTDGVPIGSQGDAEIVSFDAVKPLAAGEGGAVFCREPELAETVRRLTHFDFDDRRNATSSVGINAKMSEPAAATALAALDGYPDALAVRRALAERVVRRLPDGFDTQLGSAHGTWQFVPTTAPDEPSRDAVLGAAENRVELRVYYQPLHRMPAFALAGRSSELRVTEDVAGRIVNLPMAVDLTDEEIDLIVDVVQEGADSVHASQRVHTHGAERA